MFFFYIDITEIATGMIDTCHWELKMSRKKVSKKRSMLYNIQRTYDPSNLNSVCKAKWMAWLQINVSHGRWAEMTWILSCSWNFTLWQCSSFLSNKKRFNLCKHFWVQAYKRRTNQDWRWELEVGGAHFPFPSPAWGTSTSLQSCACACTHSRQRKSGRSRWKQEPGISGMDACHGRGTLPWSQHPNTLVRTWRTRRGTEQFFRCSWHGKMKPCWLHCEASSPVKDLPIKHRNPPAWHGGWGAGYIVKDCWKRRKSLLSSSGTKGRSCEVTLLSQAWQVRMFSLYCHLGAKIFPASLPSHFNPCIEGTLAFHFQPAGVQLSSRSTAPAASRLYPKGCCSKPQWGDRHRCHPTCSNAQHFFSLHLY